MNQNSQTGWLSGVQTQQQPRQVPNSFPPPVPTSDSRDYFTAELKTDGNNDTEMMAVGVGNGTPGEKKIWRGPTGGKIRKKRKKTPGEKNMRLRKYVQPKNAVMCLNELKPGIVYNVESDGSGCGSPTFVSVEVDGQKYRGFGSSKQLAKQAAAEAALISFVKPPPAQTGGEAPDEDKTPWAVLACFAMYKLFNEWREGRVGMMSTLNAGLMSPGAGMLPDAANIQTYQALLSRTMPVAPAIDASSSLQSNVLAAYLGKPTEKDEVKQVPNPAKQVPDNASSMHPVMLLHQMRPGLQFVQSQAVKEDKQIFTLTTDVDGQSFVGEGTNMKKAKFDLAVKANKILFNIETTYELPKSH